MKDLLKMIEAVDPNDTAKMDEIDVLVHRFVRPMTVDKEEKIFHDGGLWAVKKSRVNQHRLFRENQWKDVAGLYVCGDLPSYTRSRDALKTIRPEGWHIRGIDQLADNFHWRCVLAKPKTPASSSLDIAVAIPLPTEELAELHAIIQAIAHERNAE